MPSSCRNFFVTAAIVEEALAENPGALWTRRQAGRRRRRRANCAAGIGQRRLRHSRSRLVLADGCRGVFRPGGIDLLSPDRLAALPKLQPRDVPFASLQGWTRFAFLQVFVNIVRAQGAGRHRAANDRGFVWVFGGFDQSSVPTAGSRYNIGAHNLIKVRRRRRRFMD